MFEVKIFLETSLQGPSKKDGAYYAILEYINKKGEPVTREVEGFEKETTFNKSTLAAAVSSIRKLKKECHVIMISNCAFFANTVESGRLDAWKESGWKKSTGEEVKNKELWNAFQKLRDKHDIEVICEKHHEYKNIMREELKKIEIAHKKAIEKVEEH